MNAPTALLALTLAFSTAALAQTPWRAEYEKETNGPHGDCTPRWHTLRPGLDYRTITCLGDTKDLDLHVVRIVPAQWTLDAVLAPRGQARDVAKSNSAPFAINANFFDAAREPLGVIVQSSSEVRPVKSVSWQSIFLVERDGTARIVTPSQWKKYRSRARMAVQAGPRLVVDGHTNRVHQSYTAARAGVCIRKSGEVVFFATPQERKLDMYEIARIARRGEEDGGLACQDAMLFDGGHSAQIYAEGDGERIVVSGDPVPVFVVAKAK